MQIYCICRQKTKRRKRQHIIKKAHIAPLIDSYEKSIAEWQLAYKSAMDRDSKDGNLSFATYSVACDKNSSYN